ncbi:hypothetical protein [Streptomyces wuyuanensis]|uniref:hypothetical protein n=1 Tax=Streptomyces wuyuanensis TaxID=1196353 RepID=UPI00344A2CA8
MTFNGQPIGITPPLHATHDIEIPHDRSTLPPRILEALDAALTAQEAHRKAFAKKSDNRAAIEETGQALTQAWNHLQDLAHSTTETSKQHHREAYAYAARRLERALEEAKAAVHLLGTHALLHDTAANAPGRIGIDRKSRTKAVAKLRCLASDLDTLAPAPAIDEQ